MGASAGLGLDKAVSMHGSAPADFDEVFYLATGDVMVFSDRCRGGAVQATAILERELLEHGVSKHPS